MSLTSSIETEVSAPATSTRTLTTTPNLLVVASIAIALSMLALAIVVVGAFATHRRAADAVLHASTPVVLDAQNLYISLATADAAASTTFLQAGPEDPRLRDKYQQSLDDASRELASIAARQDLPASTQAAIVTITQALPEYAGLVESARANNRQGFPVGDAYLRDASALMRGTILPAATSVYGAAARDLDGHYRSGTSRTPLAILVVTTILVLILLVGIQIFLARRSRRTLNPGLLAATALVIAAAVCAVVVLETQHTALVTSRDNGESPLLTTSTSRIVLLHSLSDENLDLITRGTDRRYTDDFASMTNDLGGSDENPGLIRAIVTDPAGGNPDDGRAIALGYRSYLGIHHDIRSLSQQGQFERAVDTALWRQTPVASQLDRALARNVERAHAELTTRAADVGTGWRQTLGLGFGIALIAMAAIAAIAGIYRRLREYR